MRTTTPWKVLAGDETAMCPSSFFGQGRDRSNPCLPIGARRIISGKMELFDGYRQIVQRNRIIDPTKSAPLPAFEASIR